MKLMRGKSFQILDISEANSILEALYDRVAQVNDRVILTRKGSRTRCILISEAELKGLERAVEILSQTNDGAALRDEVMRIASAVENAPVVA